MSPLFLSPLPFPPSSSPARVRRRLLASKVQKANNCTPISRHWARPNPPLTRSVPLSIAAFPPSMQSTPSTRRANGWVVLFPKRNYGGKATTVVFWTHAHADSLQHTFAANERQKKLDMASRVLLRTPVIHTGMAPTRQRSPFSFLSALSAHQPPSLPYLFQPLA